MLCSDATRRALGPTTYTTPPSFICTEAIPHRAGCVGLILVRRWSGWRKRGNLFFEVVSIPRLCLTKQQRVLRLVNHRLCPKEPDPPFLCWNETLPQSVARKHPVSISVKCPVSAPFPAGNGRTSSDRPNRFAKTSDDRPGNWFKTQSVIVAMRRCDVCRSLQQRAICPYIIWV